MGTFRLAVSSLCLAATHARRIFKQPEWIYVNELENYELYGFSSTVATICSIRETDKRLITDAVRVSLVKSSFHIEVN